MSGRRFAGAGGGAGGVARATRAKTESEESGDVVPSAEVLDKYAGVLNLRLLPQLNRTREELEKMNEMLGQWSDLRELVAHLRAQASSSSASPAVRTLAHLGNHFYMAADIPQPHRLFVHVGMGFSVELTLAEVEPLCAERIALYTRRRHECAAQVTRIEADVARFRSLLDAFAALSTSAADADASPV